MKRMRRTARLHFRTKLQIELLESRRLLASDLTNPIVIEGREAVRNELLVQYAPKTLGPQRVSAAMDASVTVAETIQTKVMQVTGMGALERVTLNPGVDMQAAMASLRKNPNVLYVEPNYIYRPSVVSNDTQYTNGSLWGMYSNDSPTAIGPAGTTNQFGSQAEKAWNDNIIGNSNVFVGVIDEGVQFLHPDLVDNMWLNPFETAGDGIDNDGNGYIDDTRGWDFANNDNSVYDGTADDHGTHCAGTIGATGGNGIGVTGVAWDVTMIPLKFLGAGGGTTSNAIRAIDYATDLKARHGLNIVATSNSWGGGGFSQALLDAITRGANRNILFVAAAGNGGADSIGDNNDTLPFYPASYSTTPGAGYDAVISVASITNTGAISGFSNFGSASVDLGAPGSGIWSTVPSNTYASYNGTSMATPHVSGAIALYASTQPVGTSASSIRQALLQSVAPTSSLAGKTVTGGRLDVYELVRSKTGIQVSSPTPSATTTETGGSVSFTVVLRSAPTANVTIPVSSSDTTEGTVSTSSLVFTATNWNVPQTVTVTGVGDFIDDGNINYAIILGAAVSSDTAYNGLNPNDVNLSNQDDDTSGFTVSSPSGTFTTEAGGSVTFTVRLTSEPLANVSVSVSSSDTTEGTASTGSLVFTSTNWNTVQTVTVTGVGDFVDDGDINYVIILGAAVSSDTGYNGLNPNDLNLVNRDDDTAGITVSSPSGTTTTEAGGFVTFTIRLNSEPTATVGISISSNDTTEGTVSASLLNFTAANWSTPQTITVRGVDDTIADGNIVYTVLIWAATSSDLIYNGLNPADISLTNIDNEPVPTKFFVVNDAATNQTFEYNAGGGSIENYLLTAANTTPRGIATNVAGDRVWVVDSNRTIYVYNNSGGLLGSWMAGGLPGNAVVEGVTTNGMHLWLVESGGDRVYFFSNAASRISGTQNATSNFLLSASNRNPKDLVTDGTSIWVVDDSTSDRVFRYTVSGTFQNSWLINSANSRPTGITLDPSNGSQDIWIVDSGTDRIYRYANARTLTAPTLTSFIQLAAGNTNPTGIADPPAGETSDQFEVFVNDNLELSVNEPQLATSPMETRQSRAIDSVLTERDEDLDSLSAQMAFILSSASIAESQHAVQWLTVPDASHGESLVETKVRSMRGKWTNLQASKLRDRFFAESESDFS
jgi:subtilisin family serine protease